MRRDFFLWTTLGGLFVLGTALEGADLRVPSPYPTIQAAITAAVNGDRVLVSQGTYPGAIDFMGKAITVQSTDPTRPYVVERTIIDANGASSAVSLDSGETSAAKLDGFTIKDAVKGIYCNASSPTVTRCVIAEVSTYGIYCSGGSPAISFCTVRGGTA